MSLGYAIEAIDGVVEAMLYCCKGREDLLIA